METMTYTPIELLPPPPKKMLEEAEKEEANYMREMLEKVLTIKEAKDIRRAIWEKLNRHPITQQIYDLIPPKNRKLDWLFKKELGSLRHSYRAAPKWNVKTRWRQLIAFRNEFCLYKKGKNKGTINFKLYRLAEKINSEWNEIMGNCVRHLKYGANANYCLVYIPSEGGVGSRNFTLEEFYKVGYWNFMLYNFKLNKYEPKMFWCMRFPIENLKM